MKPRLIVCLPGSSFSDRWLHGWNALYGKLLLEYDWRVEIVQKSGNNIYDLRNECVEEIAERAGNDPPEHVLWIDSDNVVTFEDFLQLRDSLTRVLEASAVGAWYLFQPKEGEQPMIAAGRGENRPSVEHLREGVQAGAHLLEMDYLGFGFLLMKYRMLDELGLKPFTAILRDDGDQETDDVSFCLRAKKLGHRFFLNANVHTPHLKLMPIPVSMRTRSGSDRLQKVPVVLPLIERDLAAGIEKRDGWWMPIGCQSLSSMIEEMKQKIYGEIQAGDVVLDCGANVGVFSRYAAEAGAAQVVAFEPDPTTVRALRRNLDSGASRFVNVIDAALWDCETELTLSRDERFSSANSVVILRGDDEQKVPSTTVDKIVTNLGLDRVDFIKMDIEGAEKQALRGARETILKFKPRLAISVEHFTDDEQQITSILSEFDYQHERRGDVLFFEPTTAERKQHATPLEQSAP